jgi:hypothetical protein
MGVLGKFFRVQNCAEMMKNCDCRSAQICDPAGKLRRKKFYDFCAEFQENKVLRKSSKIKTCEKIQEQNSAKKFKNKVL